MVIVECYGLGMMVWINVYVNEIFGVYYIVGLEEYFFGIYIDWKYIDWCIDLIEGGFVC